MEKKQLLLINGHPNKESFNYALHAAYKEGAVASGAVVEEIFIGELQFDSNLKHGYTKRMDLESDLQDAIEKIKRADHLVWIYPMWWGTMPAVMKGFIDRLFLPGVVFEKIPNSPMVKPLLKGKTAHIIHTLDCPVWFYKLYYLSSGIRMMKQMILGLTGIKTKRVTYIAPIKESSEAFRTKQLEKVTKLGRNQA